MTQTQTRQITLTEALNEAMKEEMRRDERVFIMGEDIQKGVYGASAGLYQEFGEERVRDCPLSENAFMGAAVGAAAVGMRPIVESAFCFMWVAMDSLVSQAAKMRYMFGGQGKLAHSLSCFHVLRRKYGGPPLGPVPSHIYEHSGLQSGIPQQRLRRQRTYEIFHPRGRPDRVL